MSTTRSRNTTRRCFVGRLRPYFDRLDSRTALSGTPFDFGFSFNPLSQFGSQGDTTPLSVTSTTPSDSATLTKSPTTLDVTFNQTLSGFSIGLADFKLVHWNSDGSTSPLSPSEAQLQESLDPLGNQIDLTLTRPLLTGGYQLILNSSALLAGTDGSSLADDGQDEVVADFRIAAPQSTLQDATNLQMVGTSVVEAPGNLDLSADPGAVNYYQLTLAPGHYWSLGLAVQSQGGGGSLSKTLSLFNAQDQLITTVDTGLQNNPSDPYLFAGLNPGTYYVGVSAGGNVPDANGTYNPAGSSIQSPDSSPDGEAYQLQAVADPADQPTQVLGVRLDQADPLSSTPTGVTLQFSGALQLAGLEQPNLSPLKLVDQNGTTWNVTTDGYNPALGQLQVVFNESLPEGIYTLELTGNTSLLDLADKVPVAQGLSAGELASFTISPINSLQTGDLGPIYPGTQTSSSSSLTSPVNLAPNSTSTFQFTVVEPGVYAIEGVSPSSGLTYTLTDAQGAILASGPQNSLSGSFDVTLKDGVYTLTLANPTSQTVNFPLTILHKESVFSELMQGGIAQGAALSLRLVTPQSNFGVLTDLTLGVTPGNSSGTSWQSSSSGTIDSVSSTTPSSALASETTSSAGTSTDLAALSGRTNLGQFYNAGTVGKPFSQSNQISFVGTTTANGSLGLAANSAELLPGSGGISGQSGSMGRAGKRSGPETTREIPEQVPEAEAVADAERMSSTDSGLLARTPQSRTADARSLAGAEGISRLVARTIGWIEGLSVSHDEANRDPSPTPLLTTKPAKESILMEESRVDSASFGSPIGVGAFLAIFAYRYRKYLRFPGLHQANASPSSAKSRRPIYSGLHQTSRQKHTLR